jgi:hypothetical protein
LSQGETHVSIQRRQFAALHHFEHLQLGIGRCGGIGDELVEDGRKRADERGKECGHHASFR